MLNGLIELSLRYRRTVLALFALCAAAGVVSLAQLPIDAFPDVTDAMVHVNTVAPGLDPVEVEQQITLRLEQAMGGLPGLSLVRSISKFGLSQLTLVFADGTDIYFARSRVQERLFAVELPDGIERPELGPVATGLGEVLHYLVRAPNGDLVAGRTLQDWKLKPELLSAPGVAEVNSWGGYQACFEVRIDPLQLAKYELSFAEVQNALESANLNAGGGSLVAAGEMLLVQGQGLTSTVETIGAIGIRTSDLTPVHVRDVATVALSTLERRGVVTADGNGESVLGLGFLLMGENSHDVSTRLRERLAQASTRLPAGSSVRVVYDRTELVDLVIRTVQRNLFEALLLVVAVLFLLMGNFRASLIVALAIPFSLLFASNLMLRAGVAGTLMSLGALDFGLLVDSSVIVVENVVRRLPEARNAADVRALVAAATKEVRGPTLFGELIIILVYVPLLALEGIEGKLFEPMALTVIFALTGSLVMSLTLVPVLASYLIRPTLKEHLEPLLLRALKSVYVPLVNGAVRRRGLVVGAAIIVVVGTAPEALRLGAVFAPRLDEGSIVINTVRLPGVSVAESARFSTCIERLLLKEFPREIRTIWTRTGTPEVATDPMGVEVSDVFIQLTPRAEWQRAHTKVDLEEAMRKVLRPLPGMNFAFTQPIEMRFNEMIAGIRTDVGVKIYGDDFEKLRSFGQRVERVLATIPGAEGPVLEPLVGQPVLEVRFDHEALARYGIAPRAALDVVESLGGKVVGEVRLADRRVPLVMRLPEHVEENPALLDTLLITGSDGLRIPLRQLARVERTNTSPVVINREWFHRRAVVTTNVVGRDLASFVAEAERRLEAELGAELKQLGYSMQFGGQYENLARAARTFSYVVPIVLLLILTLVFATYGNWADSLRVFTGVPFAVVGGVWALSVRDMPFSVSAGVGFIALAGISVLADMVMVSTIRQHLAAGLAVREATLLAAAQRLRPVLMTAIVTAIGFVPMALSTGVGAEVQRPLATVVIGGVVSSTTLTLFVLPALYSWLKERRPVKFSPASAS
ncbi:MAG: efflux RND transporter permease subunit [Planctomycetota bacterium]